jgi:RimJ/RimL family protein N-acetyltransferase
MQPVTLTTARLVLDAATLDDVDRITEYCRDPAFHRFMPTPWPYEREHAIGFVTEYVGGGWRDDREFTWAIRVGTGEPLLGAIGLRREENGGANLGFWMGAPHRGNGYMPEAAHAAIEWGFSSLSLPSVRWEAVVGNDASRSVAERLGFQYRGIAPGEMPGRDGRPIDSWHAVLTSGDPREPRDPRETSVGWPR